MAQNSTATASGGDREERNTAKSYLQNGRGACLLPSLEDSLLHHFSPPQGDEPIHYADFGCSDGTNTLAYAMFVVETLQMKPELAGRDTVCYFVDLPSNNFNRLFRQLPPIVGHSGSNGSEDERTWFAAGVPGSQYGRTFPRSSLHIAISTLSLHYLPEIPKSILDKSSPAYNKGCISANGACTMAAEAYAEASRNGLREFFECRAEELASGGILALLSLARRDRAHPEKQIDDEIIDFASVLEKAWRELVNEGVIAEELLDTFNVPKFYPSIDELQEAIEHASAFRIQKLEFIEKNRPPLASAHTEQAIFTDAQHNQLFLTSFMKASMGDKVADHIGSHELFTRLVERFRQNCRKDYLAKEAAPFIMHGNLCLAVLIRK